MSWFSKSKQKRKSRNRIVKRRRFINPEYLIFLFRKIGLWVMLVFVVIWLATWFSMSGKSSEVYYWLQKHVSHITQKAGFKLENIYVTGRNHTKISTIKSAINLKRNQPLLFFNSENAKSLILQDAWVQDVNIKRVFPNTIKVNINERVPMALWQKDKEIVLIDKSGIVITNQNLEQFKDLIILIGDDSPLNAPTLFENFKAVPDIFYKIETAIFISKRRWDIVLKNGTVIKLPEENMALALSSLEKLNNENKILVKSFDFIDIRNLKRIIVKTKPGSIQKYNTGYSAYPKGGDKI